MAQKLILQASQFLRLGKTLNEKGMMKKEIARYLGLYPSVYSSLMNSILIQLASLPQERVVEAKDIEKIFSHVNNVSEKRIRREMETYIQKLEQLLSETELVASHSSPSFMEDLERDSPANLMQKIVGTYHCYYISSFNYQVKQEPFLIREDSHHRIQVQKGNTLSPSIYQGHLYLSNHQLLTAQLKEYDTIDPDHFFIHFHLPPTYSVNLTLLKGMAVSMSNSFYPIARKIILQKVSSETRLSGFNERKTNYFTNDKSGEQSPIVSYLYDSGSLIEYLPVPRPTFQLGDLQRELRLMQNL